MEGFNLNSLNLSKFVLLEVNKLKVLYGEIFPLQKQKKKTTSIITFFKKQLCE